MTLPSRRRGRGIHKDRPLRVLAICGEDPENILGGMGMHVRELYRVMASKGVEIDLLTDGVFKPDIANPDGSLPYLGFKKWVRDVHTCWIPSGPDMSCILTADLLMAKTLMRMIASGKRWDVIHMHEWGSVQLGRMAKHALGIPLIGTMHLCLSYLAHLNHEQLALGNEADRYTCQQEGNLLCDPDEAILCSKAYVKMAREFMLMSRPIRMIYNGINREEWHPRAGDAARAVISNKLTSRPIALYVGRIAEMKGITHILDALERQDTGWQVVLAGEVNANTEEEKEGWHVTRRIRALEASHPERLKWVGFSHGRPLKDLYAAASVCLMPSTHEPFGIVALEAMAMGLPLIATEVDGLGEIVCNSGREFALVIPSHSSEAIIAALRMVEAPEVRAELRELGLERAAQFTWETAAEQTLTVYHEAVRNHASRIDSTSRAGSFALCQGGSV